MKKSLKQQFISMKHEKVSENEPLFDPDENLYNDPFDDEISTLKSKYMPKVKQKTFSKNKEKRRYDDK